MRVWWEWKDTRQWKKNQKNAILSLLPLHTTRIRQEPDGAVIPPLRTVTDNVSRPLLFYSYFILRIFYSWQNFIIIFSNWKYNKKTCFTILHVVNLSFFFYCYITTQFFWIIKNTKIRKFLVFLYKNYYVKI